MLTGKEKILTKTANEIRFPALLITGGGYMNKEDRFLCTIMICGTIMVFLIILGGALI